MRIAAGIEYEGTAYHGWQYQSSEIDTIQGYVEAALSRVADQPVQVVCAGRTDTGVHAAGQVIHFDTSVQRDAHSWIFGANSYLPRDIRLTWVKEVSDDFHARFSALARRYHYLIYNRSVPTAINYRHMTWEYRLLDSQRMSAAAAYLIGTHNFSSYRGSNCQASSPIRTVYELSIQREGNILLMNIRANAFLQHMVRNIAGVLIAIGSGQKEPIWAKEVLEAQNRTQGGITAPPNGLSLMRVDYPDHFGLIQYD